MTSAIPDAPRTRGLKHITYWLYHSGFCVTAVRGEYGLSDEDVRGLAIERNRRVPLIDRPDENPVDRERRLRAATVRAYRNS